MDKQRDEVSSIDKDTIPVDESREPTIVRRHMLADDMIDLRPINPPKNNGSTHLSSTRKVLRTKGPFLAFIIVVIIGIIMLLIGTIDNRFPKELLSIGVLLILVLGFVSMFIVVNVVAMRERQQWQAIQEQLKRH